jgi:amino acid permease
MSAGTLSQRRQETASRDPEMLGNPQDDNEETAAAEKAPLINGTPSGDELLSHGGVLATAALLCKAAIGAGVMSLPSYGAEVGFTFLILMLLVGSLFSVLSTYMIGDACITTGRWSFEDITEELFSAPFAFFTGFVNASYCIFCAAAYLVVFGQAFQALTGASSAFVREFEIIVGITVCLPLAVAEHVNFLRYVSFVGVAGLVGLVLVVTSLLARQGVDSSITVKGFLHGEGAADYSVYVNSVASIIMALNNAPNVPQIAGEIRTRTIDRVTRVAYVSVGAVFLIYGLVSAVGMLTFGFKQKETLILELEAHRSDIFVKLALLAISFSTLISFELNVYPGRQFLAYCVKKYRGGGTIGSDQGEAVLAGMTTARITDISCASTIVGLAIVLAVTLQSVRTILIIAGSTAAAYVSFILPPLMSLKIRSLRREEADFPFTWLVLCYAMLLLGIGISITGVYVGLHEGLPSRL